MSRFIASFAIVGTLVFAAGCDSKPATSAGEPIVVTFANSDGYARFVNRDTLPNTTFSLRKVTEVAVQDGVVTIRDSDGDVFLVPQHRMIYAGKELK